MYTNVYRALQRNPLCDRILIPAYSMRRILSLEVAILLCLGSTRENPVFATCLVTPDARGHAVVPDGTRLPTQAFIGCDALSTVSFPAGLTAIPDSAFYDCTSLSTIEVPTTVRSIGPYAFRNCTSLNGEYVFA